MKTKAMTMAAVAAALLTGAAYAKSDGGCITKPGKPKAAAEEGASLRPLVPYCGDRPCKPKRAEDA